MRPFALALLPGLVAGLLAGCFNPKLGDQPFQCGPLPDPCPPGYTCSGGLCNLSGPVDAPPPDARSCTTPGTAACQGDLLVGCGADSHEFMRQCPVGCDPSAIPAACFALAPSNLLPATCPAGPVISAAGDTTIFSEDMKFDTSDCKSPSPQVTGGPDLCVYTYANLTINPGVTVKFRGTRIPVIVATGTLDLGGTIDVSGSVDEGGPGSMPQAAGSGASIGGNSTLGGGGGGHASSGGNGGGVQTSVRSGGPMIGNVKIVPITAGGFGGAGGTPCPNDCQGRTAGGGGGGGLQLVACTSLVVREKTFIDASGGGGPGGLIQSNGTVPGGGDGAGAGGSILIEAPIITMPSSVIMTANGGGGGSGGSSPAAGQPGQDGQASDKGASGGVSVVGSGGPGGQGGTGTSGSALPTDGGLARPGANAGNGGGGGSVGRIRFNTRPDKSPSIGGIKFFPAPSLGAIDRHH